MVELGADGAGVSVNSRDLSPDGPRSRGHGVSRLLKKHSGSKFLHLDILQESKFDEKKNI